MTMSCTLRIIDISGTSQVHGGTSVTINLDVREERLFLFVRQVLAHLHTLISSLIPKIDINVFLKAA